MPNWAAVNRDLGRKGVTLDLLWNEYKAQEPEGYGYSWFCKHYERWAAALPVTLDIVNYDVRLHDNYDGRSTGVIVAVNWL
jgi:transposase